MNEFIQGDNTFGSFAKIKQRGSIEISENDLKLVTYKIVAHR